MFWALKLSEAETFKIFIKTILLTIEELFLNQFLQMIGVWIRFFRWIPQRFKLLLFPFFFNMSIAEIVTNSIVKRCLWLKHLNWISIR